MSGSLGPDHPTLASTYCALGVVDKEDGEYASAYSHFARARELFEEDGGPDNPEVACALTHWGEALVEQRLYAEARPLLERVVELSRLRTVNPWLHVDARVALAEVLWTRPAQRARAIVLVQEAREHCNGQPSLRGVHPRARRLARPPDVNG